MAAVREELEVARQEAAQALDCLCAEREGRAQDALHLKDAVPLLKHKEALSAASEQLAEALQQLQEEKTLRSQAEERAAGLEAKLQASQDAVPKEEHEKVKVSTGQNKSDDDQELQLIQNDVEIVRICRRTGSDCCFQIARRKHFIKGYLVFSCGRQCF